MPSGRADEQQQLHCIEIKWYRRRRWGRNFPLYLHGSVSESDSEAVTRAGGGALPLESYYRRLP